MPAYAATTGPGYSLLDRDNYLASSVAFLYIPHCFRYLVQCVSAVDHCFQFSGLNHSSKKRKVVSAWVRHHEAHLLFYETRINSSFEYVSDRAEETLLAGTASADHYVNAVIG